MQPGKTFGSAAQALHPEEDIELLFSRIMDSETLRSAPMMRTLLLFLWQHREEHLSEYAVAVGALGRRSDFHPKIDATVRVQIARLRAKLKEFYQAEDEAFPLRLSNPLGGHELKYVYNTPVPRAPSRFLNPWAISVVLACLSAAVILLSVFLFVQNRRLAASVAVSYPPLPSFWQSFFIGSKPTCIIVPSPVYFFWRDQRLMVSDMRVPDFSGWQTSPILQEFAKKWGPPRLDRGFVFARDMFAAMRLVQYLENHGKQVQLRGSPNLPVDYFTNQNTIFVGGPRTTGRLQESLARTNFYIPPQDPTAVRNRNPRPGEPNEYQELVESDQQRICPGVVTLLPRTPEGTRSLLLVGRFSPALVSLFVSAEGLKALDQRWSDAGRPEAWEVVIQAEIHGDTILKAWPAAFREINVSN